jgi:MinD-like ATPase involved in chromosome partitioning or flagellar assembly
LAAAVRQQVSRGVRKLVITSSGPGEGKSTIAGNLARALAQSGRHTVALVDADPFRPTLHKLFAAENQRGIGELLADVYRMDLAREDSNHFGLGDWVELLRAQAKSGQLVIKSGDEEYSIVFAKGKVASVYGRQEDGTGRLGRLLVDAGRITEEQKDVALRVQREGQKPLGDVLHGLGYLEPAELKGTLLLQLKDSLQRIVTLPRPIYRYMESAQDFLAASGTIISEPIENGTVNDFVTGRFGDYLKYPFLSSHVSSYFTDTETPNLKLLTSGQAPYDAEDPSFHLLIDRLARSFDIVIMDTPPIAATSPTASLSTEAQGVIFVIKADGYDLKIIRQAKEQLERTGCKLLGVVLNQVNIRQDETVAYYYGAYQR